MHARVVLLERLGRRARFMADWAATGPTQGGVPVPLEVMIANPNPTSAGDGCYWAHVAALDHDGPLLVLEDDCWFTRRIEIDELRYPDCDIFYLGGQHFMAPTPVYGWPGVVTCHGETNRSHAYIVAEPRKLRARMIEDRRSTYPDIGMASYPDLIRLGLMPWVAGQRACWSSIKEIDLPDREWQWESVAP